MQFGEREEILALADERLAAAKKKFPKAQLLDADSVSVIYLVAFDPLKYHQNAVASSLSYGISRKMALRRMTQPFRNAIRAL